MKVSTMTKFAVRACLSAMALAATLVTTSLPASAASKNTNGDGSGIGGTGNSPSGGGIGGTGTREQNSPAAMPDVPDRPESVETPAIEPPDLPTVGNDGMNDVVAPPDITPPVVEPASPPQP
jgi:hypothetical protein